MDDPVTCIHNFPGTCESQRTIRIEYPVHSFTNYFQVALNRPLGF